jgi:lipoprotein signal peptidase
LNPDEIGALTGSDGFYGFDGLGRAQEIVLKAGTDTSTCDGGLERITRINMIELLVSGSVLLLLDQWSKRTVDMRLANRCISCSLLRIRRVANLQNGRAGASWIVVWFAALASAVILCRLEVRFQSHIPRIGLGFALGGAAGNLLDVWRRRLIIDFIQLGWWPVFNVADVGIAGGIVLAFWS